MHERKKQEVVDSYFSGNGTNAMAALLQSFALTDEQIKELEDYDKRYADLPKLFYTRQFFERFAQEHNMSINFLESNMEGYWNYTL